MLQNNFPVQEEFFTNYGEECLSLQHSAFNDLEDPVQDLGSGGKRSKLFFAFSSFLRGGSVEAVELAAPFMQFVLQIIQNKFLSTSSGEWAAMLQGDIQTNKAGMTKMRLMEKLMSFVTTMNTNEIYNLQLRLKRLKEGPKAEADGEAGDPDVEDGEMEVDSGDGMGKIRKKFKKINLRKDHKIRRRNAEGESEDSGSDDEAWDYAESDPEEEAKSNPHMGVVGLDGTQDASRFEEVEDVNADHPYNNWARPSRDAKKVATYVATFEESKNENADKFEKKLLTLIMKSIEHKQQSAYEKGTLLYQSFHEVFSLIADIRFFHVMAGKIDSDREKPPSRNDDTSFVQKLFTRKKEKLPEYPHVRPDDEL